MPPLFGGVCIAICYVSTWMGDPKRFIQWVTIFLSDGGNGGNAPPIRIFPPGPSMGIEKSKNHDLQGRDTGRAVAYAPPPFLRIFNGYPSSFLMGGGLTVATPPDKDLAPVPSLGIERSTNNDLQGEWLPNRPPPCNCLNKASGSRQSIWHFLKSH